MLHMAGFDLFPLDNSGSPIHLPEGETVLGRGPFLGVSDKRVSRHHGLLESLGGQLRIKPTHLNPCFCQSSLNEPSQPLDRDRWHTLRQGDIFSLLPGKYMYKVQAVGGGDGTLRNSHGIEDEVPVKTPASPEPSEEPVHPVTSQGKVLTLHSQQLEPALGATAGKETEEPAYNPMPTQTKAVITQDKENVSEQKAEPKKRVLPAWMMTAAVTPKTPSTPKGSGNRGRATSTPATSTSRVAAKRARVTPPSSGEESEHSEVEQTPRKRVRKKKSDEYGEALKATQKVNNSKVEDSEESDNLHVELEEDVQQQRGGATSPAHVSGSRSREEPGDSEESQSQNGPRAEPQGSNGGSGPPQPKAQLRTPCPYGNSCYRKNPVHFQECSHPGDGDYEERSKEEEEEEEEEDADRPECPYGADCYRKNPLHRKEFSHSVSRAKRSVRKNYNDDEEEEEDDLGDEDSFINDESEDIDEDSDYVPPDSEDSGKEDIKRLKKEAKAFVMRQK